MAQNIQHVKCVNAGRKCRWWDLACQIHRLRVFIDCHPRTGWYLTLLLALNFLIDAFQSGLF